jgi:pimeloyl-ACP methyl ester carboxylesterase
MWRKLAPRLAQDFTVVVPDLRGYGDSSKPPAGASGESNCLSSSDGWIGYAHLVVTAQPGDRS